MHPPATIGSQNLKKQKPRGKPADICEGKLGPISLWGGGFA
jgi:hypothetical protein